MQASRDIRRWAGGVLKILDRFKRAESCTVVNDLTAEVHRRKDGCFPNRRNELPQVKSLEEMPGPEGLCSLPYIGSMFLFHPFTNFRPEQSNLMFEALHRKYGRIVKFRKGSNWSVLLFDPDLIEEAISYEGKCPVRPSPPLADAYTARTGEKKGISQVHGQEWLDLRRPVQEFLLVPANINQYTPQLDEVANDLVSCLFQLRDQDGRISFTSVMLRYAIESSAVYCINTRLGFLKTVHQDLAGHHDQQVTCPYHLDSSKTQPASTSFVQLSEAERCALMNKIKVYMRSVGDGYYTFPLYKFFKTRLYRDFEEANSYLASVVQTRISALAKSLKVRCGHRTGKTDCPNLLQSLLTDGRLDVSTCSSLLTSFLSTATDNISNSLQIVLWYLAKNPCKQMKLREEIEKCVPSRRQVSSQALSYMPYLKSCLKESYRLTFPTPFGTIRILPEDVVLGGYHIPAGTAINFGHNILGHSAEYFKNPEVYQPERWLKDGCDLTSDSRLRYQQSFITMPFGFGRRNCLGRRLAEQQIYLALIKILQNFELRLGDPDEKLEIEYKITASSTKPLDIRFYPQPNISDLPDKEI